MRSGQVVYRGKQRIHFLSWGVKSTRAVVLLHGWGLNSWVYRRLASLIEGLGYYVVAIDLPGFGRSSQTKEVSLDAFADSVRFVLTDLGITQVVLIGHSMGGEVAIQLAGTDSFPRLVEKIILCGSGGVPPKRSRLGWIWAWLRNAKLNHDKGGYPIFSFGESILEAIRGVLHWRWMYRTFLFTTRADLTSVIRRVGTEIRLVWGSQDLFFPDPGPFAKHPLAQLKIVRGWGHDGLIAFPQQAVEQIRL